MPNLELDFRGKVAVVTGATRGIGKAIAGMLVDSGATVIYTGTSPLADVKGHYIPLNLESPDSLRLFLRQLAQFPQIDILINNAGINKINLIQDIQDEDWNRIIQVNLTGAMQLTRAIAARMIPAGGGHILNISSIFGEISKSKRAAYSASKAGLIGLTKAVALDLAPYQIKVNALCPGFTLTDLTCEILGEANMKVLAEEIPMQRLATVDEIAKAAVWLVSDWNTYMTGQTVTIDGGFINQ